MTTFLLLQPRTAMDAWSPADVRRHFDHQRELAAELAAAGELVEARGLGSLDGTGAAGPAGYLIIDVESGERALQIAARVAAAPGRDGVPLDRSVAVLPVLTP